MLRLEGEVWGRTGAIAWRSELGKNRRSTVPYQPGACHLTLKDDLGLYNSELLQLDTT